MRVHCKALCLAAVELVAQRHVFRGGVQRRGIAGRYARRGEAVERRNVLVGGVYRPRGAWWPAGGAIAAGAAMGFVGAATAAAWAGSPPAAGYCWFDIDFSRSQGFWDRCPA